MSSKDVADYFGVPLEVAVDDPVSDYFGVSQKNEDYSALRSGAVEFVEGAIGAGDELDAIIRRVSGDADTWEEAITDSRADLERFGDENPLTSFFLAGSGIVSGLFIPGAGMAKVAQTGTKLQRALKVGALSAAEGSVYGFLAGEGEDRVSSAAMGAGVGGVLGAASGALLTKGTPVKTKDAPGKGTFLGGNEGFVEVGKVREGSRLGFSADTSLGKRTVREVIQGVAEKPKEALSDFFSSKFLSTKEWMVSKVGARAARLAEDAEIMIRHEEQAIEEVFDTTFKPLYELMDNNRDLKTMVLNMNESISKGKRASWADVKKTARNADERKLLDQVESQVKALQADDFVDSKVTDYFPSKRKPGYDTAVKANDEEYFNPVLALKDYAQDISAAKVLAQRFNIDYKKLPQPGADSAKSRVNIVIEAIQDAAKKQGASADVAANLANGLRSQFIASKQGSNAVGAVLRRVASTALLANPLNAVLNIAEGITAPIYQNGIRAWAETIPEGILSSFIKTAGIKNKNWISQHQLGLDSDFMGELAQAGKQSLEDAAKNVWFTRIPNWLDKANKGLYKVSGVTDVNRMGQEMLANSAVKLGKRLAKNGSEKALKKLRKHDGMRGLSESEFQATIKALKDGDLKNPWLINFAGASLNKWQPVSAATLPKAFHDNPNGRMLYSMLSYMNRQMNGLRTDIGLNMLKAQELGVNSKEGAAAMREAMVNAAKYAGIFGVGAGIWDDLRTTMDKSKGDKTLDKLMTPEGVSNAFMNQIASNVTSGIVNIRSEQYGGKPIEPVPAPISATFRLGSGLYETGEGLITGKRAPFEPLLKATQTYVPGFSNVDRVKRMLTGDRLLTND